MAAGPQQIAAEGYRNHGLFTYAWLEGLAKAGSEDKVQLYDLAGYVQTRVPDLSRELKVCDAKGPREYCQKPIVRLGETPNYPLAPRYPKVLAMLNAGAVTDAGAAIPLKPTHALLADTEVLESATRGASSKRLLKKGSQVTLIGKEGDWAHIAQHGQSIGYVSAAALLGTFRLRRSQARLNMACCAFPLPSERAVDEIAKLRRGGTDAMNITNHDPDIEGLAMANLTLQQYAAIKRVIEQARHSSGRQSEELSDGSEAYAYPTVSGRIHFGLNVPPHGLCLARGVF
ncbi:MAG: SH3 domain-containing protein [Rhodomicrobium sp.]